MYTKNLIKTVQQFTRGVLRDADYPQDHNVIDLGMVSRYSAAIRVNFTDWMGKSLVWVRHEESKFVLADNLRCESSEDHVGMLDKFVRSMGAHPDHTDYRAVEAEVAEVRLLFTDPVTAGLSGLTLMTILENASEVFIPVLEKVARHWRSTDLTYTRTHGKADVKHSRAFRNALEKELTMGYGNPKDLLRRRDSPINTAWTASIGLINSIFKKTH